MQQFESTNFWYAAKKLQYDICAQYYYKYNFKFTHRKLCEFVRLDKHSVVCIFFRGHAEKYATLINTQSSV